MSFRKSVAERLGETVEHVPQVTSLDPNERKLARRLRIERRWEALNKGKQSALQIVKSAAQLEQDNDEIQIQLKKSAELLEKFMLEGEEYITNVRVANDSREIDRRECEGLNKEKIFDQLHEESESAAELFNRIANKWMLIQRHNDPLHINESITDQKEKCDMLISQKDTIIAMLNEELNNAEKQFTRDQRKQIEDIKTLSQRIEKQISFMRRAYREELQLLESVMLEDRKVHIEVTDKKWDELFWKRENQEISNSNKKFEQVEVFTKKIDQLRIDFQEYYRETKIKIENDIEELQRELEKIKALALLNSEKLDYNYQILKKREDENIIIKSQQKRRMNKLQDVINDLRAQISNYETTTSHQIKKFSDNIKKLHKSIVDVEAKADHFAHVNDEKFHMLWEMNKSRVTGVLKKILETDKILYEQQMGLDWDPPQNNIVDKRTLPSYKIAVTNVPPEFLHEVFVGPNNKTLKTKKLTEIQGQSGQLIPISNDQNERDNANYKKILRHILIRISDKSGFLAEKRLKELLKGYMDDQKNLVKLESVFAALGIQGTAYIDILFKHFRPYTYCPVCQGSMIVPATSRIESRVGSDGSQMSSIFTRYAEGEDLLIPELDAVIDAVRQPDNILSAIIADLVNIEDIVDEDELISETPSEDEDIDEICGVAAVPIGADKIKTVQSRKRLSASKLNDIAACQLRHPLVISPIYVLRALREFVSSYYVRKAGLPTTGARLERKRMTISRFLSEHDIKAYWEKFKLNFSEDRVRVWDALLEGLVKYHEILKDRRTICDEVLKLRKENAELKRLLSNYLDHHELLPPSCANQRN